MLTISKPLNAGQAQTYHAREFTSPEQNYWQKGDVNLGEWQGSLAQSFGLSGYVDAEHFARLSQGQAVRSELQQAGGWTFHALHRRQEGLCSCLNSLTYIEITKIVLDSDTRVEESYLRTHIT